MNDTAWVIDTDGTFLAVNDVAVEKLGYPREELLSMRPHDIDDGLEAGEITELIETMPEDEVQVFETAHLTKDGERIPVEISSSLITYEGDTAILSMARDITERRERQETLQRRNDQLRVLNRLVRHDIRNDMNLAVAFSRKLRDHVDVEGEELLDRLENATLHAVDLTKSARDFIETLGRGAEPDLDSIDVGAFLQEEVDSRRSVYPKASFVVRGDLPSIGVTANELLSSVFRNLLNNAVQHNDAEDPRVEIDVEHDADVATVRIADNGPGIPDPQKESLFGRDEDNLASASGIGLYLVDTLVTEYGGDVWVEDNDPRGAVFVVELPLAA